MCGHEMLMSTTFKGIISGFKTRSSGKRGRTVATLAPALPIKTAVVRPITEEFILSGMPRAQRVRGAWRWRQPDDLQHEPHLTRPARILLIS
jgi:hypothetical protein